MFILHKVLPICAIATGLALAGITSDFKTAPKTNSGDPIHAFEYNAPSTDPYTVANVQNTAHWSYTSDNEACETGSDEACKIYVSDENAVPNGTGGYNLKPGFTISAMESSTDIAYVTSTTEGTDPALFSNRPE